MTELTFLGRILEALPMTEGEEEALIIDICRGLRAAWLDYMTQDPAWLSGYKHRLYKLELEVVRDQIRESFYESWFEGRLEADDCYTTRRNIFIRNLANGLGGAANGSL
tara:strand:+ start:3977 stop:4303 length:327 start_codon:yes stop_codon:yes gene_type:complete